MTDRTTEYLASYRAQAQRIAELETEVELLKSVISDIQNALDDIPSMQKLWKAVDEMQSDMKSPHGTWIYRL